MDTFDNMPHSPEQEPVFCPAQNDDGVFRPVQPVQPEQPHIPAETVNGMPRPEFLGQDQVFIRRGPGAEPQAAPEAPRSMSPDGEYAFRPEPRREFYRQSAPEAPVYRQPQAAPAPEAPAREPRRSPYADSPYVCQPRQQEVPYYVPPKAAPAETPRKKSGFWRRALAAVLTVVLVAAGCGITGFLVDKQWQEKQAATSQQLLSLQQQIDAINNKPQTTVPMPSGSLPTGEGLTPAQVYAMSAPSVVSVNVSVSDYYGEGTSAGTGFILTEDGYIVTNYHVVEGGTSVSVTFLDGETLEAKVVGFDATNDVAVLKVEAQGLPAVTVGSSSAANVGDMVVAIGNALGELNSTQTVGFICGKDREITTGGTIINMLQIDAAINPGNSGGPLFNMAGQVIGITTAKYSGTTSSGASIEGIGFAIPIDDVMGIIEDLQAYGYVTGAYLGVTVQNVDPSVSQIYGISGAYVIGIEPGYAADRAGLQGKDLIVALNGKDIGSITDLTRGLRAYKAGDTVTLTVIRDGIRMDLQVTLDEKPADLNQPQPDVEEEMPEGDYDEWYDFFFGDEG